jgi:peptide/nickel transport system ATP-binding protein
MRTRDAVNAEPGADALLEVTDLRVGFRTRRGTVRAVDGVTLGLVEGRTLGIVGESGSGKSVLCRAMIGLLPRRGVERSGSVVLGGRDVHALSRAELRRLWATEVGVVVQNAAGALNPVLKVGRQMALAIRIARGCGRAEARELAGEMLRSVGISDVARRLDQYPHELSGGMVQRVVIAVALAGDPRVLIADEPTTALDVTVQAQILDLLEELKERRRLAVVLVTHDLGVVMRSADDVAVMYGGRVVETLPANELLRGRRHPYTRRLLDAVPRHDVDRSVPLKAIPGEPADPLSLVTGCSFAPRCERAETRCAHDEPPLRRDDDRHAHRCFVPEAPLAGAEMGAL